MSEDRYAALQQATGGHVVKAGDMWWTRVRPCFYRPLLPLQEYDAKAVKAVFDRIGIYQHGVENGQAHNSYLNPVVFDKLQEYDPKSLQKGARGCLKKALKENVSISRVADLAEFCGDAYPVYIDFYNRTRYGFDTSRREKDGFRRWARTVLDFPEAVVLGAYIGTQLLSFEISCLVGDTLIIKTVVHSGAALAVGVPDFFLHCYRSAARECRQIRFIYDGMLGRDHGVNQFKLLRGAKILAMPAHLHLHPSIAWMIRRLTRGTYERLCGFSGDDLARRLA